MDSYTTPDGRLFTFQGSRPYVRKDGSSTTLDVWVAACSRPGCRGTLEVVIPGGSDPSNCKAFGKKHCPEHLLSPEEIKARWLAACTQANTKASPELIAELVAARKQGVSCAALALLHPLSESRIRALTTPFVKNRSYTKKA